eukprot:gene9600-19954_t
MRNIVIFLHFLLSLQLFFSLDESSTNKAASGLLNSNRDVLSTVHYIEWITSRPIPDKQIWIFSKKLSIVSNSNDNPMERVNLPFVFPFFGENHNTVVINPNGALQFDSTNIPPCGPFFGGGKNDCGLENSYYGIIAGFLTDLNPPGSITGEIRLSSDNQSQILISYNNIPYFGKPLALNSFHILLHKNGHIGIELDNIQRPESLPLNIPWLVGVRPSKDSINIKLSNIQKQNQKSWNTSVYGLYPPKKSITSNISYNLCPVSINWCLRPAMISRDTSTSTSIIPPIIINITTLQFGCTDNNIFEFHCIYKQNNIEIANVIANISHLTSSSSSSTSSSSLYSSTVTTFSCHVPHKILTASAGSYKVTIRGYFNSTTATTTTSSSTYRGGGGGGIHYVDGQESQYIDILPMTTTTTTPLNLTVYDPSTHTPTSHSNCDSTTWINATSTLTCDTCAICNLNFTCFDHLNSKLNSNTYDCNGVCGGNNTCTPTVAPTSTPPLFVNMKIILANISYSSYLISKRRNSMTTEIVQVTNPNDFPLYLLVNISGSMAYDPYVNFSTDFKSILHPLSTGNITVDISMKRVFSGIIQQWNVKTINIYSSMSSSNMMNPYQSTDIDIDVVVSDCNLISTPSVCSSSPGCIYCAQYPNIRLLQEAVDDVDVDEGDSSFHRNKFIITGVARRLYNSLVPGAVGDVSYKLGGQCISDTDPTRCPLDLNLNRKGSGWIWLSGVIIACTFSLVLLVFAQTTFVA